MDLIRKELLKQIKATVSLFLVAFVLGQGFNFDLETSKTFSYFLLFPIGFGFPGIIFSRKIRRAFTYQFLICSTGMFSIITIMFLMYSYIKLDEPNSFALLEIILNLVLVLFIAYLSAQGERKNLQSVVDSLSKSGKLDLKNGTWDLSKPMRWEDPLKEKVKLNVFERAKRFSALFVGLGMILARLLQPSLENISLSFLLFYCYLSAYGSGRNLNLLLQFIRWEKDINRPIYLKTE